jgi:hypothetical protein
MQERGGGNGRPYKSLALRLQPPNSFGFTITVYMFEHFLIQRPITCILRLYMVIPLAYPHESYGGHCRGH